MIMNLKLQIIAAFLLLSLTATAQWSSRASFPGVARAKAASFTIGDKIYVMGGVDNLSNILNDFWEYNITTNVWTQKTNFPGPGRYGAATFVLNNLGYIATGANDSGYLSDLWQYEPVSETWMQRPGLPSGTAQNENQRTEAFAFVANGKAYLGGGQGFVFAPNNTFNIAFADLWEFDPVNPGWTAKSGFPDFTGRIMAVAGSINNKGYVGLGCNVDQTFNHQGFWEYDPASDIWTPKANFPTTFTADAGAFTLNSLFHITGGVRLSVVGLSNQFYSYNPTNNTWNQLPLFNGGAIAGQWTASTATSAFIGGGYNSAINTRNDVWEYSPGMTSLADDGLSTEIVSIYPNPASSHVFFDSDKTAVLAEVFDLKGKLIFQYQTPDQLIDISNLIPGFYNIKISFDDGSISNKRLVKSPR
jgi:hypothetical protein